MFDGKILNFGFVGHGYIAHEHARVVQTLGHKVGIVLAKENSEHLDSFCCEYGVEQICTNLIEFKKCVEQCDALVVCTPWNVTEILMDNLLELGKPLLVEKPMVLSRKALEFLASRHELKNILIAYNRRYYSFIPKILEFLSDEMILHIDLLSSEPYEMMNKLDNLSKYMLDFYSCHVVDLLFYLIDDIEVVHIGKKIILEKCNYIVQLYSKKLNCFISLKILLDVAQNSYIKIYGQNHVFELVPLEKLTILDGMQRVVENGISIYKPQVQRVIETPRVYKAGFMEQMKFFIENYIFEKNSSEIEVNRLYKMVDFFEKLKEKKGI